jgi:hypothetical protein
LIDFAGAAAVAVVGGAGLAVSAGLVFVLAEPVAVTGQALAGETTELKIEPPEKTLLPFSLFVFHNAQKNHFCIYFL